MNKFLKDGTKNDLRAFSVRLPEDLVKQIDVEGKSNRRNRNGQITFMLEAYLDLLESRKGDG